MIEALWQGCYKDRVVGLIQTDHYKRSCILVDDKRTLLFAQFVVVEALEFLGTKVVADMMVVKEVHVGLPIYSNQIQIFWIQVRH